MTSGSYPGDYLKTEDPGEKEKREGVTPTLGVVRPLWVFVNLEVVANEIRRFTDLTIVSQGWGGKN